MSDAQVRQLLEGWCFLLAVALVAFRGKERWQTALTMVSAAVYACGVEEACVIFRTYRYTPVALALPSVRGETVPIWIAVGWGTIVYFCTFTSTRLRIGWFSQAAAAGLLALNIDFALDPIATHYQSWIWKNSLSERVFGVPWQNFVGWWCIVAGFAFVAFQRPRIMTLVAKHIALANRNRLVRVAIANVAVVLLSLALFGLSMGAVSLLYWIHVPEVAVFASVFSISLLAVGYELGVRSRDNRPNYVFHVVVWMIPVLYHALFVVILFASGILCDVPGVQVPILLMAIGALVLFAYPALNSVSRAVRARSEHGALKKVLAWFEEFERGLNDRFPLPAGFSHPANPIDELAPAPGSPDEPTGGDSPAPPGTSGATPPAAKPMHDSPDDFY